MVKSEELRIGNLLDFEYGEKERRFGFYADVEDGNEIQDISEGKLIVQPIPLTPEILTEWCGFEKINGYMVNKSKNQCHTAITQADKIFKTSITGPFGMVSIKSLTYLHQLQNLFYSLIGEELEIKIPSLSTSHTS